MDSTRTKASRVLAEIRSRHQSRDRDLSPGHRMELAFQLSLDALELARAGLKAQGLSETEILKRLRSRR